MTVSLFYRELASGLNREPGIGLNRELDVENDTPPVILLHGLFGSGDNLGSLARQLAATRRVLQVDLRNHGQSPHSEHIDLPIMAADVLALMEGLGITRCDIVGHSLGGKVAMQLAMQHTDRVRRLVIADIAPVNYTPGHDQVFAALSAVDLSAVQSRRDAEAMMTPHIDEPALRQFLLKGLYRDGETGYRWRFNLAALKAKYDALRAAPMGESFAGPTLFIKGELSNYISDEHESSLRALFPAYSLQTVPGAGHWVHGEQPELFNRLVEEFLS